METPQSCTSRRMRLALALMAAAAGAGAAPAPQDPAQARWQSPCSVVLQPQSRPDAIYKISWARQLRTSITKLKKQLNVVIQHYDNQKFSERYKQIQMGTLDHQEVAWIPGKGDVMILMGKIPYSDQQMGKKLRKLHKHLQKFAMAFARMIEEETDDRENQKDLELTENYLIQFLCEVETALFGLDVSTDTIRQSPPWGSGLNALDVTRRRLRDWHVLLRYRNYLDGWARILRAAARARRPAAGGHRRPNSDRAPPPH